MTDVLVVGAGPAGCIAAIVLARAGARVTMIDRASFPRPKLCGDSLNPGALALLARLGLVGPAHQDGVVVTGMEVTGEDGARIVARYPPGVSGRIISRCEFDAWLVGRAEACGVCFESGQRALAAIGDGRISGVEVADARGKRRTLAAPVTIAADGRHSTLAFGLGLARHPARPRRWAVGGYFENVRGLTSFGEMHVRTRRYIGVAPLPNGLANLCVVTSDTRALAAHRNLAGWLETELRRDPGFAPRLEQARLVTTPVALGPLAVDAPIPGVPGLLLAGDAAGFIDPLTGDGLYFAMRGGELAAEAALGALSGSIDVPHEWLFRERRRAFRRKQQFNRAVRALSDHPAGVRGASAIARVAPWLVAGLVRVAGDVDRS